MPGKQSAAAKSLTPSAININDVQRGGEYADVVRFATEAAGVYGSATNAIAQAVRASPQYKEWKKSKK